MVDTCASVEPCHSGGCDGYDEVVSLLPRGRIWNPERGGTYGAYVRALGDIKSALNQRLCREQDEVRPCTASRLLPYWAKVWGLPDCVALTADNLCRWIEVVSGPCPPGTLGFLRDAINFVAPGKGITINVTYPDVGGNEPAPDRPCASDNALIVTGPPSAFAYEVIDRDRPFNAQDGKNICRSYFIPEVECLRRCVFPFGLSVGYRTDPTGPNGEDIFGVPDGRLAKRPPPLFNHLPACEE